MRISDDHKAKLYKVNPNDGDDESDGALLVQFNPTTLAYSLQNTLERPGRDANAQQFVAQTTAKLDFDLVFDSTHDGSDVRSQTDAIKQFLNPGNPATNAHQAPPLVGFRWGTFRFKGIVESFKETLDFFSAEGVPLRSSLKIVLAAQDARDIFATQNFSSGDAEAAAGANVSLVSTAGGGASALAARGGNPGAGRALGAANGFESLRDSGGGMAAVASGGVELKPAAAFASGSATGGGQAIGLGGGSGGSGGIGGGGFGLSGGIGGSLSGGLSGGTGGGALGGGLGGSLSAGFGGSASLQPFAGLGPSKAPAAVRLDFSALRGAPAVASATSSFGLGGQVTGSSSAGLRADMGAGVRIRFDTNPG